MFTSHREREVKVERWNRYVYTYMDVCLVVSHMLRGLGRACGFLSDS